MIPAVHERNHANLPIMIEYFYHIHYCDENNQ